MRYSETPGGPNVLGGSSGNVITAGVQGATIAGGGCEPASFCESLNSVTDDFGTVGGGARNLAGDTFGSTTDHPYATVGGGDDANRRSANDQIYVGCSVRCDRDRP
jgi:hypothetical protein